MELPTPESSSERRPLAESMRQELTNRLSEVNQLLSVAYETEKKNEADLRRVMRELEESENARYGLLMECIDIEKKLYPEILG